MEAECGRLSKEGKERREGLSKYNCRQKGNEDREVERKRFGGDAFLKLTLCYRKKKTPHI